MHAIHPPRTHLLRGGSIAKVATTVAVVAGIVGTKLGLAGLVAR